MAATEAIKPPLTVVGPIAWLRKNLFSTWYNALLTIVALLIIYSVLRPSIEWAFGTAKWGVISANMTLFMIGQYPRDQLWRIWATIFGLAALVGWSWGVWKAAVRGFAVIALGAAIAFTVISLGSDVWGNWLMAAVALLIAYGLGARVPRAGRVITIGWLIYVPIALLLIAGTPLIAALPPVELNLWGGLLLTLTLAVVGNLGSLPLGVLLALGRRSKLPIVHYFCVGYIELIRGVPLVTILYMADILLPLFLPGGARVDRVIRAVVGFILFEAAYQAENVRGGLQAIPRGQYEAAQALGFNTTLTNLLIILPQAIRLVIPALIGSFISLFKDTSLIAIIGLFDILRIGRTVLAQSDWLGTHREVFLFAFFVYWGFNLAFSYGSRRLEKALGVGQR
ncbi:MAG: amino acid ABC transporter permease [Chloroflexi bacterium]|nr:amino acid ABC transporter permease [Chloroflexota bacterium]